jgi:hypothetical protein
MTPDDGGALAPSPGSIEANVDPGDRPHAFNGVLAAVEQLVQRVEPTATWQGNGDESAGWALPEDPVPFLLVRVAERGVDVFVPDRSGVPFSYTFESVGDVGWADFEHALRVAVANAQARRSPVRATDMAKGPAGDLALPKALFVVGAFFSFEATSWQRLGIVALLPWALVAVIVGLLTGRVLGESDPGATGSSPLPGLVGLVIGAGGWALTVRWAYRRFPPTAAQRAAAREADREFLRTNSRTLGCLALGAWFFAFGAGAAVLGSEAVRGQSGRLFTAIMALGIVVVPVVVTRYVRRRYPAGPRTGAEVVADTVMLLMLLLLVAVMLYSVITTPPT